MIRPTTSADVDALIGIVVATGLIAADETGTLEEMLEIHFAGHADSGSSWLTDDEGGPVGVSYSAPERLTSGTWNLLMIAVRPDYQGKGHGAALLRYVEQQLTAQGERMLLVETSGTEGFERTREFYRKAGYEEEARIRDYYDAGDDKIVFRKVLPLC